MFSRLTNFIRRDRILVPEEEEQEQALIQRPHTRQAVELAARPHTRRFFFGIMAGAVASAAVVPQLVDSITYAPVSFPANRILTIQEITKEALMVLQNNLHFSGMVNRSYSDAFDNALAGHKIGHTLNIRKPLRFAGLTATA